MRLQALAVGVSVTCGTVSLGPEEFRALQRARLFLFAVAGFAILGKFEASGGVFRDEARKMGAVQEGLFSLRSSADISVSVAVDASLSLAVRSLFCLVGARGKIEDQGRLRFFHLAKGGLMRFGVALEAIPFTLTGSVPFDLKNFLRFFLGAPFFAMAVHAGREQNRLIIAPHAVAHFWGAFS